MDTLTRSCVFIWNIDKKTKLSYVHDPVSYLPPSGLLTVTINLTNKASNEHNYLFVDTGQSYVQRTDKYVLRRNYHKSLNLQQEHMNQLCQKRRAVQGGCSNKNRRKCYDPNGFIMYFTVALHNESSS